MSEDKKEKTKAQKDAEKVKFSVNKLIKTEDGKALFTWMCKVTGFHDAGIAIDPRSGLVDPPSTAVNAARRIPYILLRRMVTDPKDLAAVELPEQEEVEEKN